MGSNENSTAWIPEELSLRKVAELYTQSVTQTKGDLHAFECLRGMEHSRDNLIKGLFERIHLLNEALRSKLNESHQFGDHDIRFQDLEKKAQELQLLKAQLDIESYVLVLINGDGLIFRDSLLVKGEEGGGDAARELSTAIREHLMGSQPTIPPNCRIVVRIYANVQGLGQACFASGIIDAPATLQSFVRGFNGAKHLFDFVDVSLGKDRADSKIEASFDLQLSNLYCRQIILGISHDNGYARRLEDVSDNPLSSRVYLLEGLPFGKELVALKSKYKTIKFEGLFRDTKINVYGRSNQAPALIRRNLTSPDAISTSSEVELPFSVPSSEWASPIASPEPTLITKSENPRPMTWATMAHRATSSTTQLPQEISPLPPPLTKSQKENLNLQKSSTISHNSKGQRIDTFYLTNESEWRRIQKLHLCNIHFLRQECNYGKKCTHAHSLSIEDGGNPDGTLTKRDLEILTQVSRYAPCRNGTGCDDPKCIFGHRCPVQENTEAGGYNGGVSGGSGGGPGGKRGKKDRECRHGKGCKFPSDMHGVDTRVVSLTKV